MYSGVCFICGEDSYELYHSIKCQIYSECNHFCLCIYFLHFVMKVLLLEEKECSDC